MYYKIFTKQKDWAEAINKNNIDIYKAIDCSSKLLLKSFQDQPKSELESLFSNNSQDKVIQIIAAPAMVCVLGQIGKKP